MIKKNGAAYKVIFQVGVFQGNNFNLTTAYVMTLKKKIPENSCNRLTPLNKFWSAMVLYALLSIKTNTLCFRDNRLSKYINFVCG